MKNSRIDSPQSALARADDEQPRVDGLGEMLDRQRRVADELPNAPVDAVAVEDRGRLRLHDRELALAGGDVHVDRRRVDVPVGVFVGHEPRDVHVDDQQRGTEETRIPRALFEDPGRQIGDHPDDHGAVRGIRPVLLASNLRCLIRHAPSTLLRRCETTAGSRRGARAPCYPECYSYRPRAGLVNALGPANGPRLRN